MEALRVYSLDHCDEYNLKILGKKAISLFLLFNGQIIVFKFSIFIQTKICCSRTEFCMDKIHGISSLLIFLV